MEKLIKISEIVNTRIWVKVSDGQKVYEIILPLLRGGDEVVLSFADKEFITTSFLGAAIGDLYRYDVDALIVSHLTFTDTTEKDIEKINRVISNAKRAALEDSVRGQILDKEVQL